MKPYGIPRIYIDGDLGDCATYGLKSSVSTPAHHQADRGRHGSFRNKEAKARARRIWKRKARIEAKALAGEVPWCSGRLPRRGAK